MTGRVHPPSAIARSRVEHLVSGDKRLIDMLAYAYEVGVGDAGAALQSAASIPLPRASYEGIGGWNDGRWGQAYDLIHAALKDAGHDMRIDHPILHQIEMEGAA